MSDPQRHRFIKPPPAQVTDTRHTRLIASVPPLAFAEMAGRTFRLDDIGVIRPELFNAPGGLEESDTRSRVSIRSSPEQSICIWAPSRSIIAGLEIESEQENSASTLHGLARDSSARLIKCYEAMPRDNESAIMIAACSTALAKGCDVGDPCDRVAPARIFYSLMGVCFLAFGNVAVAVNDINGMCENTTVGEHGQTMVYCGSLGPGRFVKAHVSYDKILAALAFGSTAQAVDLRLLKTIGDVAIRVKQVLSRFRKNSERKDILASVYRKLSEGYERGKEVAQRDEEMRLRTAQRLAARRRL